MSGMPGKKKARSTEKGRGFCFIAGFYGRYEDGGRFVILTIGANASMKPFHDRMPLVLEWDEIVRWILDDGSMETILRRTPYLLEHQTEYEQLSLF